jgi:hypothetical protein
MEHREISGLPCHCISRITTSCACIGAYGSPPVMEAGAIDRLWSLNELAERMSNQDTTRRPTPTHRTRDLFCKSLAY